MKALLPLLCLALVPGGFSAEPPAAPAPANSPKPPRSAAQKQPPGRAYTESDVAVFRAFLMQRGPLTAEAVEARFGPPPKYSPLMLNEKPEDATREHAWWYYPVGPQRSVGVMVDGGQVKGAFYFFPRAEGAGVDHEMFRKNQL